MPVLTADTRMAGEFRSSSEGSKTLLSMSNRLWLSKLGDSAPLRGTGGGGGGGGGDWLADDGYAEVLDKEYLY